MMKKIALLGYPVSHSKSPLIHNYWMKKHALDASYEAIAVAPEDLETTMLRLIDAGYAGLNVTIPHKETVFTLCDDWDDTAKRAGAVNIVVIEGGKCKGFNTDIFGFTENIRVAGPRFDFKKGPAVVLGAGGAARAVVLGLLQEGAPEIRIANRTKEKAQLLARDFKNLRVYDWDNVAAALENANMLVNATSLGMQGKDRLEIDLSALPRDALVNDMVYVPLQTDLLRTARERGNPVVTGIGTLLHQARAGFKEWFGIMPEIDAELKSMVLR